MKTQRKIAKACPSGIAVLMALVFVALFGALAVAMAAMVKKELIE